MHTLNAANSQYIAISFKHTSGHAGEGHESCWNVHEHAWSICDAQKSCKISYGCSITSPTGLLDCIPVDFSVLHVVEEKIIGTFGASVHNLEN